MEFVYSKLVGEWGGAMAASTVFRWAIRAALGIVGTIFLVFLFRGSASASTLPLPADPVATVTSTLEPAATGAPAPTPSVSSTLTTVVSAASSSGSLAPPAVPSTVTATTPAPVVSAVGNVTAPVSEVGNVTAPVVSAVADVTAPVVSAVANVTAPVVSAVSTATPVVSAFANVTAPVVSAVGNVTAPVVSAVSTATPVVSAVANVTAPVVSTVTLPLGSVLLASVPSASLSPVLQGPALPPAGQPVTLPGPDHAGASSGSLAGTGPVSLAGPSSPLGVGLTGSDGTDPSASYTPNNPTLIGAPLSGSSTPGSSTGHSGESPASNVLAVANGQPAGGGGSPSPLVPAPLLAPRLAGSAPSNGQTGSTLQLFGRAVEPSSLDAVGWNTRLNDGDAIRSIRIVSAPDRPG